MARNTRAAMYHAIADELGCDPELVGVVATELKLRKRDDVKHAVTERLSRERNDAKTADAPSGNAPADTEPKARKASLTLSQRRALLRLLADATHQPKSAFKALPYEHLVRVGYADRIDTDAPDTQGVYTLTDAGLERAASVNPGYRVWSAGETVAGDPTRPVAGQHKVVNAGRLV